MRAQTAAVVDTERSITLAAADPKAKQQGFGGLARGRSRLAAVALDASKSRIIDATTGEGAAPSDEAATGGVGCAAACRDRERGGRIVEGPRHPYYDRRAVLSGGPGAWTASQKPKVVNPLLAPPAVSGPYWGAIALFVWGRWLASLNWSWCNVPFAVDPTSPFHFTRFEQLDTLCVWDPDTRTGRLSEANDLSLGYETVIKNQIRRVTGDETAPKARANAPKSWDRVVK